MPGRAVASFREAAGRLTPTSALCLPLGSTEQLRPAAMANLLGDAWSAGEPCWADALGVPGAALHLYGKQEPKPGRKMGHLTATAETADEAVRRAVAAREALKGEPRT